MTKVADLAIRMGALEALVGKLSIETDKKEKKPRNMTEKGELHKAKLLFYQEKKGTKEVKTAYKIEYGEDLTMTFKNWTQVKKITDAMFSELCSNDKDKYIQKSRNAVAEDTDD
jgi:hypothetical protein